MTAENEAGCTCGMPGPDHLDPNPICNVHDAVDDVMACTGCGAKGEVVGLLATLPRGWALRPAPMYGNETRIGAFCRTCRVARGEEVGGEATDTETLDMFG